MCIIGRSGSGKSTLLRCLNFLEEPTAGIVQVGDLRVVADPLKSRNREHREQIRQIRLSAQMVFQSFNLFPHMSALGNVIEAPMRVLGLDRDEAVSRAESYLERVGAVRQAGRVPGTTVRRPETARGDRPGARHGAQGAALRRADVGARSDPRR